MGETVKFQEKRQEFLRKNKVELDVPKFAQEKNSPSRKREVYRGSKEQRKRAQERNKRRRQKILAKRIGTIGLVGLIAFGGVKAVSEYNHNNAAITLEQALENGESLKTLKIDKSIEDELNEIKGKLANEEMSNEELIKLSTEINGLQFDNIKTKLSKTLKVDESDIELHTSVVSMQEGETYESVTVENGETYGKKGFLENKNTISDEISQYIKDIGKMQTLMGEIQSGDINRSDIFKEYKKAVKGIDQMAAAKMSVDEKGNITVEKTKVKELKENNKEKNKETSKQEIVQEDDMER